MSPQHAPASTHLHRGGKGGNDMTRSGSAPRVPSTVREIFDDVAARTDAFCGRHLDEEYAQLCTALTAKLVVVSGVVRPSVRAFLS
jgi:hypothetical protein